MAVNPLAAYSPNEIVEATIGGNVYKIEKLGSKIGSKLFARLARAIGPVFEGDDQITKLCASLKDEDLDYVCATFSKVTRVSPEGNPAVELLLSDVFDKHFAGHYGFMVLWLKACLEANYGDFLGELGVSLGTLAELVQVAKLKTGATPESTSPPGAASLRASAV